MIQVAYALVWWLLLLVVGAMAFPLVSRVCGGLSDRGYGVSKLLGLLLITYFSWILASARIIGFGYANISIALLLLLAVSLFLGRRHLSFRTLPWRSILTTEAIFTVVFVLFLVFLRSKPDIYFGYSEDFMDFAFLQAVLRSDYFPPADPWLAGESLSYYYGGHLLVAIPTFLVKIPAGVSYNLAVAMFVGLAAAASYGLGLSATGRRAYGFLTAAFVCVVGFMSGAFQWAAYATDGEVLGHVARQAPTFNDWWLNYDLAAQVIPDTGNSYPYYTFLQGDLHPHTMSIPFQIMFISIVFAIFKKGGGSDDSSGWLTPVNIFVLCVSLGFFAFVNAWDYPAYLGFTLLAFILLRRDLTRKGIAGVAGVLGLSALLYLPFFISRGATGVEGMGLVDTRTDLIDFVELVGLFLFVIVSFFCVRAGGRLVKERAVVLAVALTVVAALLAFLWGFELAIVLVPVIIGCLYYIIRAPSRGTAEFMLLLVLMGAAIALLCEIVYVNDSYYVPYERYNTVLKFYLLVWVFLAIGSAYGVFWVRSKVGYKTRALWTGLLVIFIGACVIQPIGLTAGWSSGRQSAFGDNRGTLDGLAYVQARDPGAYEAILWLNENVEGSPVILEAPGATYQFTSIISTMTGLPTIVGWPTHEVMWRGGWDKVAGRDTEANTIYETVDEAVALALLEKYDVEYIYVGAVERDWYGEQALGKFELSPESYELVFQSEGAMIYRVVPK
jgi:YYY domain-containing protein